MLLAGALTAGGGGGVQTGLRGVPLLREEWFAGDSVRALGRGEGTGAREGHSEYRI